MKRLKIALLDGWDGRAHGVVQWLKLCSVALVCLGLVACGVDDHQVERDAHMAFTVGDYQVAAQKWSSIAERNERAAFMLGLLYEKGLGVAKDESLAMTWYERASKKGSAQASIALYRLYARIGQKEKSYKYFLRAVEQGHYFTRFVYALDHLASSKRSIELEKLDEIAAESSDFESLTEKLNAQSSAASDVSNAVDLALSGSNQANLLLGKRYYNGAGVRRDFTVARWFMDRAGGEAKPEASFYLGSLYAAGAGVVKDCAKAEGYLRYSADAGYEPANIALSKLKEACLKKGASDE